MFYVSAIKYKSDTYFRAAMFNVKLRGLSYSGRDLGGGMSYTNQVSIQVYDSDDESTEWWGVDDLVRLVHRTGTDINGMSWDNGLSVDEGTKFYEVMDAGRLKFCVCVAGPSKEAVLAVAKMKVLGFKVKASGELEEFSVQMVSGGVVSVPDAVKFIPYSACDSSPKVPGVHTMRLPPGFDVEKGWGWYIGRAREKVFPDLKLVEVGGDVVVTVEDLSALQTDVVAAGRLKAPGFTSFFSKFRPGSNLYPGGVYTLSDSRWECIVDFGHTKVEKRKKQ